jgi:hypothetical protein
MMKTFLMKDELYAIIAGDELTSLRDAKNSPDWPEWEQSMKEQLDLLNEMGTWKLVQKPPNAVAIPNKWTFIRKRDKAGEITQYKGQLVAKGCVQ